MLVNAVQFCLFGLTVHAVFFGYIFCVRWFTGYPKPMPPQIARIILLRYLLWLLVAGIGWLLFATHLLYWGVVFLTLPLYIAIYYLTLGLEKRALQRRINTGAA